MDEAEEFCRRHWRPLARTLAVYTDDITLGQELAQEALAHVVARWERVAHMDSPGGYAYRIGVNLAKDDARRRARTVPVATVETDRSVESDPAAAIAVRGALAGLPVRQRLAVSLRYLADLSVSETAMAMGCQPGTVKALCHQATRALRTSSALDWHPASEYPAPDEEVRADD